MTRTDPRQIAERTTATSKAENALDEARCRIVDVRHTDLHVSYPDLLKAGWTPMTYRRLADLGAHALAAGAWIARRPGASRMAANADAAVRRLTLVGEAAATMEGSIALVEPWLAVLSGVTDRDESNFLHEVVRWWGHVADAQLKVTTWAMRLGEQAALAWAAGVTLDEAVARRAAGTLDDTGLWTMAALRGYRLPNRESTGTCRSIRAH